MCVEKEAQKRLTIWGMYSFLDYKRNLFIIQSENTGTNLISTKVKRVRLKKMHTWNLNLRMSFPAPNARNWQCSWQCCGSMTFWGGYGSGSADPCPWLIRIWVHIETSQIRNTAFEGVERIVLSERQQVCFFINKYFRGSAASMCFTAIKSTVLVDSSPCLYS